MGVCESHTLWTTRSLAQHVQACGGRSPAESQGTGAGNGLQDSQRQPSESPKDSVLSGATRSRVRRQDGAGSAYLQRGRDRAQERRSPAASGSLALLRQKARYSSHREYRPGIDLLSGEVLGLVRKRHRSAEFIEFLRLADANYPRPAPVSGLGSTTIPPTFPNRRAPSWPCNLPLRRNTGPGLI